MNSILFYRKQGSRQKPKRIALIGYRASGKTTVGKALAKVLGWSFLDMDIAISNEAHATIREIVQEKGWSHFRKLEVEFLNQIKGKSNLIVATGGGIILGKENRILLRDHFWVIWLKASVSAIRKRLQGDSANLEQRPSLTGENFIKEIDKVLSERQELYRKTSHFSIVTSNSMPGEIVQKIMNTWERM